MVKVKIKKLHDDMVLPTRMDELCGGWDVTVTEIEYDGESYKD